MEKRKTPRIRFKGFSDDWEQRKLEKFVDVCSGMDYKHLSVGNIPVYGTGGYMLSVDKALSYEKNAIGIGRKGTIDKPYILKAPFWTVDTLFYCIPKNEDDLNFVYDLFQRINWRQKDESTGVPSLSKVAINNTEVMIPTRVERKKIGESFKNLDTLITLHQRKLEKLKIIKKSMLEKFFPKNEEKVPQIRFLGFTDDWEQRKLGICFEERLESMPEGELISVTINDGIKRFADLGRHDNSNQDKSKYKKICIGDIAYNSMRMWQGASGYSEYEGIVSPAYTVLKPNEGIDSKCVSYLFKRQDMIHIFQLNSQGITSDNWNLKFPALSQIEVVLPKYIEEQKRIATYFSNLDRLITLHQGELEKFKKAKKSMLESMFV